MIWARNSSFACAAVSVLLAGSIGVRAAALAPGEIYTPQARALNDALYLQNHQRDNKWRASVAGAVSNWCDDLWHRVPRNAPAEDRWVEGEFADQANERPDTDDLEASMKRTERFQNSIEFKRYFWSRIFANCSSTAKSINEGGSKSRADEALLWIELIGIFNEREQIEKDAIIFGLVPRNYFLLKQQDPFFADQNYIAEMSVVISQIVKFALPPLLKGQK